MKRFQCPACGKEVHFKNMTCVHCGTALGIDPVPMVMVVPGPSAPRCANAKGADCNWVLQAGQTGFCLACRHNDVVPDRAPEGNRARWSQIELAKRQLVYALLRWSLPHPTRSEEPVTGLSFAFLADVRNPDGSLTPLATGHQNGVITLNIAESDDVVRAERRTSLGEPYRTIIGHLRHEVGHYYWWRLIGQGGPVEAFRGLFGDERQDYGQALQRHYANGPPANWNQTHISAYATAHPWEDFAETWAHWMHIVDGLETARAYGLLQTGQAPDPYLSTDIEPLIDAWVPVTVAVNEMNRGMGQPDLYPFVLSKSVLRKLRFINDLIHNAGR